jgi:uncharacterized protein
VWIQDAYTTTNGYPYSQRISLGAITAGHQSGQINYIRNSVKVVVDAFTGRMTYYVVDPSDPVIQVWEKIFPSLFATSPPPMSLQQHFRYPEDLFTIQANQYAKYHVQSPSGFYQHQDFWAIPTDPALEQNTKTSTSSGIAVPLRPYYVVMRLPGSTSEEFVLIMPFTPSGRPNMVAWMAAKSDPSDYGHVVTFQFPTGVNVDGPTQVSNQINSDPTFAQQQTLLSQGNSRVVYGNFLVIPIEDSFLYVQPIFVQSAQLAPFPELKRVVVVQNRQVGVGNSLTEALANSLGQTLPPTPGPGPPTPTPPSGPGVSPQVTRLLTQALHAFAAANTALTNGDLGTYQTDIKQAESLIRQANRLAGQARTGTSPTPSPSPSK